MCMPAMQIDVDRAGLHQPLDLLGGDIFPDAQEHGRRHAPARGPMRS